VTPEVRRRLLLSTLEGLSARLIKVRAQKVAHPLILHLHTQEIIIAETIRRLHCSLAELEAEPTVLTPTTKEI
jgi:hypothetical protein